jgi:hypothetical protein
MIYPHQGGADSGGRKGRGGVSPSPFEGLLGSARSDKNGGGTHAAGEGGKKKNVEKKKAEREGKTREKN